MPRYLYIMSFTKTRWCLAALCLAACVKLMLDAFKIAGIGAAGHLIGAFMLLIGSVILIAPETVVRVAEWCSRPITDLIFPSEQLEKPPLSYRLARHYAETLRLEEAATEYAKIIEHYPEEADAYVELLAVAKRLGDDDLHERYSALLKKRLQQSPPKN
jgi:hypothetical protein